MFITHDISVYGASKSLQLTLKGLIKKNYLKKEDVIILYNKALRNSSNKKIKKLFRKTYFSRFKNSKSLVLPLYPDVVIGTNTPVINKIINIFMIFLSYILWIIKYSNQFKKENLDCIYLNSVVLWPMLLLLPKKIKIVLHIREILSCKNKIVYKIAKKVIGSKCSRLIAIDSSSALPFIKRYNKKIIVLKNPFDMEKARLLKKEKYYDLCMKYNINNDKIHISIIGNIYKGKGQDFFCEISSLYEKSNKYEFLIVGNGEGSYYDRIISESKKQNNLVYLGEVEEIEEIYAISDIIVRCDDFFPLGRTVWEGFYSGCKVILPVDKMDDLQEINDYINKDIFIYKKRNKESFKKSFEKLLKSGLRIETTNLPYGNLNEYTQKIKNILLGNSYKPKNTNLL